METRGLADQRPDIEIGRYALRTFKLSPSLHGDRWCSLSSISQTPDKDWSKGTCEAVCPYSELSLTLRNQIASMVDPHNHDVRFQIPPTDEVRKIVTQILALDSHQAPGDDCTCGIYGTVNLVSLTRQYPDQSKILSRGVSEQPQ